MPRRSCWLKKVPITCLTHAAKEGLVLTLFKARSIITMNPSMSRASAVLVRDGMIMEVGEPEHMQPWLEGQEYTVDEPFADNIICPGFIDPHLHPSMAAVLLPMEFITAMRWSNASAVVTGSISPQGSFQRMAVMNSMGSSTAAMLGCR